MKKKEFLAGSPKINALTISALPLYLLYRGNVL